MLLDSLRELQNKDEKEMEAKTQENVPPIHPKDTSDWIKRMEIFCKTEAKENKFSMDLVLWKKGRKNRDDLSPEYICTNLPKEFKIWKSGCIKISWRDDRRHYMMTRAYKKKMACDYFEELVCIWNSQHPDVPAIVYQDKTTKVHDGHYYNGELLVETWEFIGIRFDWSTNQTGPVQNFELKMAENEVNEFKKRLRFAEEHFENLKNKRFK